MDAEWVSPIVEMLDNLEPEAEADEDEDALTALGYRIKGRTKAVERKVESLSYPCKCGCGEIITWKGIGRKPRFVDNVHARRAQREERNRQTVQFRQDNARFGKDQVAYLKTNTRNSGKRVKR